MPPFRRPQSRVCSRTRAQLQQSRLGTDDEPWPDLRPCHAQESLGGREDLLKKKDFLPDGVRACPRASVVDPGCSNTRAKGSEWVAGHREELPQLLSQNSSLPPPIPRPTVPTMPWQIIEHQHSRPSSGPIVAVHIEYLDGTFLRLPRDLSPQPPMVQPRFQQPLPPHSAVKRSYNTV
jgi:hypothetical protein